jgi:hypothetical protein
MRLVLVAAALVFEPIPIAMFLSMSIGYQYKLYYGTCALFLSSVYSIMECFFFYDLNGSVVDCGGDNDDSFI